MFATTPNEMADAGGVPPDSNSVSMRPAPSGMDNFISGGVSAAMGHGSELGANILGSRQITDQYDSIRKHDSDFADTLANPGYSSLIDIQNALTTGNAKVGTFASKIAGLASGGANHDLVNAIEGQKKIEEWRKSHPEATDVPTLSDLIGNVKRQQDVVDEEAAETNERDGYNIPLLGKVSPGAFTGGIAASFAPSNPVQAAFNLALAGTGGISKSIVSSAGKRIAANAAANGVVSAVSQSVLAAPAAEQYGVERNYKQEAFGVLANTILGGVLSGVHEGYQHYFPATTVKGVEQVKGAVDSAAKKSGVVGDALRDLTAAKTPDEAQAIAIAMPLETRLDVLHEVSPNPSAEERGVMQAGEKELLIEIGGKQAGMEYPAAAEHAVKVEKAIDAGQSIPETPKTGEATLPRELAGAKPRYGYQNKQFTLSFESDIDKALYITAQKTASKMDAAYRAFLRQNGLTDAEIQTQGASIREKIKSMAKGSEPGHLNIERTAKPKESTSPPAPQKEKPVIQKPIQAWLQRMGGVRSGSNLAKELQNMGIRKPGFIRTMGRLTDVDNIAHSEWPFGEGAAPRDSTGNYIDRQHILDEIAKEQNIGSSEKAAPSPGSTEDLEKYAHDLGVETGDKSVDEVLAEIKEHEAQLEIASHANDEIESVGAREEAREALDAQEKIKYDAIEQKVIPREEGKQAVIPGAEKISDKSLAQRIMSKVLRSDKEQKPANEGLFDTEAQKQQDLFKDLKPEDAAPVNDEKATTVKDAIEDIKEHENLLKAMTTCFLG